VARRLGWSPRAAKYCALQMTTRQGLEYWPAAASVVTPEDVAIGRQRQCVFQVRLCPESFAELSSTEPALPAYFQLQFARQLLAEEMLRPPPAMVVLELAVLDMARVCNADCAAKGRRPGDLSAAALLRQVQGERTLQPFVPSNLARAMGGMAAVAPAVEGVLARVWGLTDLQLTERFVTTLLAQPGFGTEIFDADIGIGCGAPRCWALAWERGWRPAFSLRCYLFLCGGC
jgi:hypothetical protein